MSNNNISHSHSPSEGQINISEIFSVLREYKYSILASGFIFMLLAAIMAYVTPNTYQAISSIEIISGRSSQNSDFLAASRGIETNNVENEMTVLSSYLIKHKALENLNLGTRYFSLKNFKTEELYKQSPFIVTTESIIEELEGRKFKLIPVDQEDFYLILETSLMERLLFYIKFIFGTVTKDKEPINYNKIHQFNTPIYTPWFTITVQKIHALSNNDYSFSVQENEDAIDIEGNLMISPSTKNGSIIQLAYNDTVAQRGQEILESIVNAYINHNLQLKKKSAENSLSFIDKQLTAIHKTLNKSATSLQRYKSSNTLLNLDDKAAMTAGKLSDLETQVYDLDIQINVIGNILNFVQTHKSIEGVNVDSVQSASPTIVALIQEIQANNTLEKSLLIDYTEFHPEVIKIKEQSKSLKNTLIEALKHSLTNRKQQKESLAIIIDKEKTSFESFPEQEKELAQLSRSFMANEKIYEFLLEKRAEAAILQSSTLSGTRVVDLSILLNNPIKPKRSFMVLVGLILGLIIGLISALIRAKRNDFIRTASDVMNSTEIPIFGMLPKFSSKHKNQSFYEALRVVRTNIDFVQGHNKSKIITVTSSISGEGKTTLITELAKILVLTDKKIILLDLDMRKPTVHVKLRLNNRLGMSTILSGQSNVEDAIQVFKEAPNLHVISSGPIPPNPSELILSESFKMAVQELSGRYDYILFDSPPIGHVTDASTLMHASDISIIVLKIDFSKKDFIKNINRLKIDQKLNIGLVLNGLKENNFVYGYGSTY